MQIVLHQREEQPSWNLEDTTFGLCPPGPSFSPSLHTILYGQVQRPGPYLVHYSPIPQQNTCGS